MKKEIEIEKERKDKQKPVQKKKNESRLFSVTS
uniref:Uncharacterized protein n=1 Tax=Triticum urartu TaxID=4572 RepID=A0A8R7UGH2_TRIUA